MLIVKSRIVLKNIINIIRIINNLILLKHYSLNNMMNREVKTLKLTIKSNDMVIYHILR